jgi:hypothetical protein
MVKKKSAPKVKETLDITDELIAERRTSLKMPKDMIPWMAKTIEFIDAKMLLNRQNYLLDLCTFNFFNGL